MLSFKPTHRATGWSFVGLFLIAAACTDGALTSPANQVPPTQPALDVISLPVDGYIANTTKIVFEPVDYCNLDKPETFNISSMSDASLQVSFDKPLCFATVPTSWATWGSPPNTESATPMVFFTGNPNNTLTLTLSKPVFVFGLEIEPNNRTGPAEFLVVAKYSFSTGAPMQTVSRWVNGQAGARLFGWSDEGITKVELEVMSPNPSGLESQGFAIAQLRYRLTPLALTPEQQVDKIIDQVNALGLAAGTTNSLRVKLDAILAAITAGDISGACTALGSFRNEVKAQTGKKISAADAAKIVEKVNQLSTDLGCS